MKFRHRADRFPCEVVKVLKGHVRVRVDYGGGRLRVRDVVPERLQVDGHDRARLLANASVHEVTGLGSNDDLRLIELLKKASRWPDPTIEGERLRQALDRVSERPAEP